MSEQTDKPQEAPVKKHKGIVLYWLNLVLLAIIVIALNYISFSEYYRRDLTQDQRFDISEQTVNVLHSSLLANKKAPVKIIFAFQRSTPNYTRMRALLEDYQKHSDGKIILECVDPLRQPNRARELQQIYELEFKQNQVVIDAREDTTKSTKSFENKQEGNLHVRIVNGNNFVVYEQGTTKAIALQMEDIVTAQLISALEGTPRRMYFAADKSNFSTEELANPDSIFATLNRACLSLNIQLVPIRLAGLEQIPADAAGFMLIAPQYDLTEQEQSVLQEYWKTQSSGLFIALDPRASDTSKLNHFLREYAGVRPQDDRVLLRDRKKAYYEINALFAPSLPWMDSFKTKSTGLEGESFSILLEDTASSRTITRTASYPLLITTDEYYGETKYSQLNSQFDPNEDNVGPLILAAAVERGNTNDINLAKETARMVVLANIDMLSPTSIKQEQRDFVRAAISWITDREELAGVGSRHDMTIKLNLDSKASSAFQQAVTILLPLLCFLIGLIIWNTRRH